MTAVSRTFRAPVNDIGVPITAIRANQHHRSLDGTQYQVTDTRPQTLTELPISTGACTFTAVLIIAAPKEKIEMHACNTSLVRNCLSRRLKFGAHIRR